jgi:hypothetical protein
MSIKTARLRQSHRRLAAMPDLKQQATRRATGRDGAGPKGIQARFDGIPDIHYGDARHWTSGDRGVSEWTIRGTRASPSRCAAATSYWKLLG